MSIEELINVTNKKNHTIQGLQKAILSTQENIILARKWQNPVLSFGVNDISLNDASKRDSEAMQAQFIGITQVIPMGNKLEYKEEIALKEQQILNFILEDKKLEFQSKIFELYYSIAVLEKKHIVFGTYLNNIKKLEKLNLALYEENQALQTEVLSTTILYSKIELQQLKLQNIIQNLYAKLEEITQEKINQVHIDTSYLLKELNMDFTQHPKLQAQEGLFNKALVQAQLEKENKIPDITLNVAYFQRDKKYEDYLNFSVAIPLALYGTENSKVIQAKSKSYEERSRLKELEKEFTSEVKQIDNDFKTAKKILTILEKDILPTQQKLQESMAMYNSLNKAKPQEVVTALNEYLNYELLVLDEQLIYFQTLAKAHYFNKGKMQ